MNLVGTTVCVLQRVKAKLFTRVPVAQCGFPSVWSRSLGRGESVQIKAGGGHVALLDFNRFASEVADQLLVDPLWGNSFSVTYMVTCHSKSMACTSLWFCKQEAWVSETISTLPESPTNSDCWTQAVWPKVTLRCHPLCSLASSDPTALALVGESNLYDSFKRKQFCNEVTQQQRDDSPTRYLMLANKKYSARSRPSGLSCWAMKSPRHAHLTQYLVITSTLSCPPELDSKILLLRTQQSHRAWRNQASSHLGSFIPTGWCLWYWKLLSTHLKKRNNFPSHLAVSPASSNNSWPDKIQPLVQ